MVSIIITDKPTFLMNFFEFSLRLTGLDADGMIPLYEEITAKKVGADDDLLFFRNRQLGMGGPPLHHPGLSFTGRAMREMNMKTKRMSRRKKGLLAGGIVLLVLAILAGAFSWYVSDYYRAEDAALEVLAQDSAIEVQDNLTILSPTYPTDTAIIFYPGAKVEAEAYLPLLDQIRQLGVTCILVHMPFHMAIFDADAAEEVMEQFPEYRHWYMAGHSMGGAMASQFAADHPDEVDGLILLGAYLYGDYPPEKALTIYGSLNQSVEDHIDYTENIVEIEGGNHAQFGNYGPQKGDLPATISAEEQQRQTVEAVEAFLAQRNL